MLELPSGSEDGLDIDAPSDADELWDKFKNVMDEENMSKFEEMFMEEFDVTNAVDELVNLPLDLGNAIEENDNYLNIGGNNHSNIPEIPTKPLNVELNILPHTNNVYSKTPVRVSSRDKNQSKTSTQNPTQPSPPVSTSSNIIVKDIKWSLRSFPQLETNFKGNSDLPKYILELDSPYQIFKYFFPDLLEHIWSESVKYGIQKYISNMFLITPKDLEKYFGILILMSLVNISNIRKYWAPYLGNQLIQETMNINTLEKIRSLLYLNDKTIKTIDKTHKIRPIIETLMKKYSSIPLEENLSINEQMCSIKSRCSLKVYMPNKSYNGDINYFFFLCGAFGFAFNFELCTRQENNPNHREDTEPDLGASANVVVRLSRLFPKNQNYKLYFDNYYTTLPLLVYLRKRKMFSLGTVRRHRLKNVKLPDEKVTMKKPRGSIAYCIAKV